MSSAVGEHLTDISIIGCH